jgi:hypothetical protein
MIRSNSDKEIWDGDMEYGVHFEFGQNPISNHQFI